MRFPISQKNVSIVSWGIYSKWKSNSKELPKIQEFTLAIPIIIDQEWGMIISIDNSKDKELQWEIKHPPLYDEDQKLIGDFKGNYKVLSNEDTFFLGDTFWEPLETMQGEWTCTIRSGKQIIAKKIFKAVLTK